MNSISSTGAGVLRDATRAQLEQAVAYNHQELFCLEALASGGAVKSTGGLTWTFGGTSNSAAVAFPAMQESDAGALLDTMMDYYRVHTPDNVGCWSLASPQPADIGLRLLARGFQPGWSPCWMALDLDTISNELPDVPGLQLRGDNNTDIRGIKGLPYVADNGGGSRNVRRAHPDRAQRFIASLHGKIVAQSSVFFTTGDYGVAGIYNVGVVPEARHKGIGKAITLAACLHAKERGYRYAVLNAAARELYAQIGFQWINDGLTWWLMSKRYRTHPPSPAQVALAEATGRGDISALESVGTQFTANDLNTPITNGMTLVELAVHCRQPASADWLVAHGASYSALDAWDLGWKDRAAALLANNPQEVNRQYRDGHLTLLHTAAQRNDIELAALALKAKPDLTLKDSWHDGTPLGWAEFFRRPEITAMIKAYAAQH